MVTTAVKNMRLHKEVLHPRKQNKRKWAVGWRSAGHQKLMAQARPMVKPHELGRGWERPTKGRCRKVEGRQTIRVNRMLGNHYMARRLPANGMPAFPRRYWRFVWRQSMQMR